MQSLMSRQEVVGAYERTVSWLCRPDEVVAHLFFAAAEIGQIQVDVFEETMAAVLAFPHQDSQSIDIIFPRPVAAALGRGAVRIRYHHEGSSYEFLTAVTNMIDDRRWRLSLPNAVARWAGRGADRFSVRRDPRFMLHLERDDGQPLPQQLHDLSTTGLSFVFRPAQLTLEGGDQLLATMRLPGDHWIPILLEVRHTRDDSGALPILIAGCHLLGVSPWGRALINQAIAGLAIH